DRPAGRRGRLAGSVSGVIRTRVLGDVCGWGGPQRQPLPPTAPGATPDRRDDRIGTVIATRPGTGSRPARGPSRLAGMRIPVSSDMDEPVARALVAELRERGHEVRPPGALSPGDDAQWAACSSAAARAVADGTADPAVVCCWTGTGASIAANKVPGVRAALCTDAYTADGARRWNDANVLALSLRLTSEPPLAASLAP